VSLPYKKPLRVGLYGRVSIDTREGRSVDSQLDVGHRWAEREAHTVVAEYRDDGVSAYDTRKVRGDWARAMEDIISRKLDVLWVWEVSRASRDRAVWAKLIAACQLADVRLAVDGKMHDVSDPDDGFTLDLGAALAVRESAQIGKRVRRATQASAEAGRPFGSIPFGYRREYDPGSGMPSRQVPDEETAPIVREIVARVLAGDALHGIAVDFNRRGVPTPQQIRDRRHGRTGVQRGGWNNPKLRKLLSSPTMAGWRVHQGRVHGPAGWEPLVSAADHAAALAIINDPGRRTQRGTAPKYLLSGIAECGVCGAWMRRFPNRGFQSYGCAGLNATNDGHVVRRAAPMDAMVTLHVTERLRDPGLLEALARARDRADESLSQAGQEIAHLQAQIAQYTDRAVQGSVPAELFETVIGGLHERLTAAQSRLVVAQVVPQVVLDLAGPDAAQRWALKDVAEQRRVVRALVRVVVHRSNQRRGVRGFDESSVEIIDL
jgi:DNA invertase Pin-like site-specific DNA recombinase